MDGGTRRAPRPAAEDEARRQASLDAYKILDSASEATYDRIVSLAAQLCRTPMAFVSLIDHDRQWFKARCGLQGSETSRDIAFCAHAILETEPFIVEDASKDVRFADNPLVIGEPHIRFYAGVPLRSREGEALGTLCVADTVPRRLSSEERSALETLASDVEAHLELRRRLGEVQYLERQKRELVGLVVHDLKNPLTSIMADAAYIRDHEAPGAVQDSATSVLSAAERMHRLTLDMLDISRSEDGQLQVRAAPIDVDALLTDACRNLAYRAKSARAELTTQPFMDFVQLRADRDLIRRVLENLVENALKYGEGAPVHVAAELAEGMVVITVADQGPGVPEELREEIFVRYSRLSRDANHTERGSQGLGLSFCRMAVEAHGGRIWVEPNTPRGSRFRFALPMRPARR